MWYGGHHNAIGGKHRPGHGTMEFQPGFAATAELGEYLRGFTKHVGDIFVKMRGCVDALWRTRDDAQPWRLEGEDLV